MRAKRGGNLPDEGNDEFLELSGGGSRALLGAILGQAVRDLSKKENPKMLWPELKISAAKWILGIGKDNGGGISIDDVANELGVSSEGIAAAIGAEQKLEDLIREKAEKRARQAQKRRDKSGLSGDCGMLMDSCYA